MSLIDKEKKDFSIQDVMLEKSVKNLISNVPEEAINFLISSAEKLLSDEKTDREAFQENLDAMSDDDLRVFVPDVYQKDIYDVDYVKMKSNGIELISFDIDDTINDCFINNFKARIPGFKVTMPDDAKELFKNLKSMGFTVTLLTNAQIEIAKGACDDLKADGYICRANKPETTNFEAMLVKYNLNKTQMAHVGNSMRDDVAGGNKAGVTTCLVRRNGYAWKLAKFAAKIIGLPTKGHLIREKLLERDIWRKHHKRQKGDQYYQLGELPAYQK